MTPEEKAFEAWLKSQGWEDVGYYPTPLAAFEAGAAWMKKEIEKANAYTGH
jgi:hypothetical protein